jgi:para-nitrobenzyl esterase
MGAASPADRVTIDAGALQGAAANGVASFKGVPYARPPVGVWRWRPPQRPAPWSGGRDAACYGPVSMQTVIQDNGVGPWPASEDCLTLNVFAPEGAPRQADAELPVMVWIHGGGFVDGSGTAALCDGAKLVEQGVVIVTLNYRLGRFGFFAHPALTAETPKTYLANYGLMDQIAALQWVQRNIAAFGGDPKTVTIFGASAGGMAVARLMMIREARGLFHRAIIQSGRGRERGQTLAEAETVGTAFARRLGVSGNDSAALRAIPAAAIVAGDDFEVIKEEAPILDGRLLSENPMEAFGAGRVARVPLLIGSDSLEPTQTFDDLDKAMLQWVPTEARAALVTAYGSERAMKTRIISDADFGEPARAIAREHAISGHPTWLYRFSVASVGAPPVLQGGALQTSEQQYTFQTLPRSPSPTSARDAALAKTVSAYWAAFAKTGDPNGSAGGEGRPHWPAYSAKDQLMEFTSDGPMAKATPDAAALDAIAERYRQPPPAR